MLFVTLVFILLSLAGSFWLLFTVPARAVGEGPGLPFRQVRSSPEVWQKSHRFAGFCLFISSLFLAVPPIIWGWERPVLVFLTLLWGLALLPLLALTVYAYSLLQLVKERKRP